MFAIDIDAARTPCTARLSGELTIYNAAELRAALLPMIAQHSELELELSGVEEIDTAGLQVLMVSQREALERGGALRLAQPSRRVVEVFEALNLGGFFNAPPALPAAH